MITLHHANTVNNSKTLMDISRSKIERLFQFFNQRFKKEANEDGSYSLNTGLDAIDALNPDEYNEAYGEANKQGWESSHFEDNYDTITYKLTKK